MRSFMLLQTTKLFLNIKKLKEVWQLWNAVTFTVWLRQFYYCNVNTNSSDKPLSNF